MTTLCSGPECGKPVYSVTTGLCRGHNAQLLRRGELTVLHAPPKYCSHTGCISRASSKGYCRRHYMQMYKHGRTYGPGSEEECRVDKCHRPVTRLGMCQVHSKRGEEWEIEGSGLTCQIFSCESPSYNGLCRKHRGRAQKWGLSNRQFTDLIGDGTCPGCLKKYPDLDVHHDHRCCDLPGSCGECVISALCSRCNRAAGFVSDNAETLRRLAAVLEQSPWKERY